MCAVPEVRPAERRATPPAAIAIVMAVAVVAGQVYLVAANRFLNLVETPFLAYSLAGSFAIHFWTRPGRGERLATFALAVAAAAVFILGSGRFRGDWPTSIACAGLPGLASLIVLAAQVCLRRGAEQDAKLRTLLAGSVFGYTALFIGMILSWTTRMHARTYDLYLYVADAGYRLPISQWAGQLVAAHEALARLCGVVYESLPLAVSLVYAYERSGSRPVPVRVLPAFLGGGAAAYLLYNFLPATGPHYVFGAAFPNHMPAAARPALVAIGDAARNAAPSMHLACALLIWWCCAALPRWARWTAMAYLALTVVATLGFGEHYVVDLVAAVPYALALAGICGRRPDWRAAAAGIALTAAWTLALRFGTSLFASPLFTWTATAVTIATCSLVWRTWGRPPGLPTRRRRA